MSQLRNDCTIPKKEKNEHAIAYAKEFLAHMGTGETEIRQLFEAPQDVQKNYETLSNLKASQATGKS